MRKVIAQGKISRTITQEVCLSEPFHSLHEAICLSRSRNFNSSDNSILTEILLRASYIRSGTEIEWNRKWHVSLAQAFIDMPLSMKTKHIYFKERKEVRYWRRPARNQAHAHTKLLKFTQSDTQSRTKHRAIPYMPLRQSIYHVA